MLTGVVKRRRSLAGVCQRQSPKSMVGVTGFEPAAPTSRRLKAGEPIASRRPQLRGARPPNRAITRGQRDTMRTGSCHYEPIGGITVKPRRQTVDRDYDLSIEG